ncbi:hypothetical protein Tco_1419501 [Tanacetum coccineum]
MEECHRMLTDQVDLVNPEGHRLVPDDLEYLVSGDKGKRSALSISKLKAAQYLDFGLEELVSSLWIKSEHEYDIGVAYGISHWWFKRKEFYITRHNAPFDRSTVRSHMRILSVVSLKTYERCGYAFLKEIVLRRADCKEYKILEADFKNLHPNDFEDLYLLHLQGQLNHLSGKDKVHLFNAINMWIRNIVIRKRVEDLELGIENYTIVSQPRALIYKEKNDQKKMMREIKVHKFSDGTLNRILDKLDHMVKDFKLFEYNKGMETRIWSEDDRRRSKDFMEVIERRLKIRRIFRSLKSFVGGRLRDVDYRLIQRTDDFIILILSEDGNPVRANIKQALGSSNTISEVACFEVSGKEILHVQYLYCKTVLTEPEGYIKMDMQIPHSSRVKFIATCSYSRLNDFITSRKNDLKLPQTLISTSSSVCQSDGVMN